MKRWLVGLLLVPFYGSKITDAGLAHLKGLTNLKSLGLHNT
jgi:hypothetical protein